MCCLVKRTPCLIEIILPGGILEFLPVEFPEEFAEAINEWNGIFATVASFNGILDFKSRIESFLLNFVIYPSLLNLSF